MTEGLTGGLLSGSGEESTVLGVDEPEWLLLPDDEEGGGMRPSSRSCWMALRFDT